MNVDYLLGMPELSFAFWIAIAIGARGVHKHKEQFKGCVFIKNDSVQTYRVLGICPCIGENLRISSISLF